MLLWEGIPSIPMDTQLQQYTHHLKSHSKVTWGETRTLQRWTQDSSRRGSHLVVAVRGQHNPCFNPKPFLQGSESPITVQSKANRSGQRGGSRKVPNLNHFPKLHRSAKGNEVSSNHYLPHNTGPCSPCWMDRQCF